MNTDETKTAPEAGKMAKMISYDEVLTSDILELMGAKEMPNEQKEEIYQAMMETITNRVLTRIDDKIEDKDVEELKQIVEENDKDKFFAFFQKRDIDINQIYMEEALIYKLEMVNLINSRSQDVKK